MGRKPNVTQEEIIKLIEKYIDHFTTNNFPPFSDKLWTQMSQDLNGRWLPCTVYTHVRSNKRGDLSQARQNQRILTSPKLNAVLIEDISESDEEEDCDTNVDDDYTLQHDEEKLEIFDLLLSNAEWTLIKPDDSIDNLNKRLRKKTWAAVITRAFWNRYNFNCAFLAKWSHVCPDFEPEKNKYFLKFVAYCKDDQNCKNIMIGTAYEKPNDKGLRLLIKTRDTRGEYHKEVKRPLNGAERKQVKLKLQKQSAANYQEELLKENMEFGQDVPYFIQKNHIYRQVKMEMYKEKANMKPNEKLDVLKALQKLAIDPQYINNIHNIGSIRFYVWYCAQEQLHVFKEYVRVLKETSQISIDATGRVIKKFEIFPGKITGHIFLYTVTINFEGKTICVYQMVSEIHTQEFIEDWLKFWMRLGAPAPAEKKRKHRPAKTLIRIDVAHLMALVSKWKCLTHKDHPYIKNFFLRCVALLVDTQSVQEFQRIFFLICIVALQPYENTEILTSNIQITVLDARKELEQFMSVRKVNIDDLEASMTCYQEIKKDTISSFEEDYIKELERIAKEFPLWTAAAIPGNKNHASTAYQEGYFAHMRKRIFEFTNLPCSAPRFIIEHLDSLKNGSNLLAAKLKHFNHQQKQFSPLSQQTETLEDNTTDETNNSKLSQKKPHVTDDSDVLAYEKWKGLKNKQLFIVNNEDSDEEPAVVHNFKVTTEQALIRDISSLPSELPDYEAQKSFSPQQEETVKDHTNEKIIHNTSSLLSHILDYETQTNNFVDDFNLIVNGIVNRKVIEDKVINCEENSFDTSISDLEKYKKLELETSKTKSQSYTTFYKHLEYTSTPLTDHTYATVLISTDEEKAIENNEIKTTAEIVEKRKEEEPDNQKHNDIYNNDIHSPAYLTSDEYKQEILKKQDRLIKKEKENKIKAQNIIKSKGFYFQPFPEIKLLNERKSSRKKGFILINGLISNVIKIKCSQFSWNFNLDEPERHPQQYNEIKVFVKNTCAFDAFFHIIQFSGLDNPIYYSFIQNSKNSTLQFISNVMKKGLTTQIFFERLKILNEFYPIKKSGACTSLSPYEIDAEDFIIRAWNNLFRNEPSGFKIYHCSNVNCIGKANEKIPFLSVNDKIIKRNGYKDLQKAIFYHPQIFNIKCTQPGCVGLITEENNLNIHILIELDVRDSSNMANTMEYCLNDFSTSLELGKKYRLAGVIHYHSGHFTAYCLRTSGLWLCCDDLKDKINNVKETTLVKPHAALYVLE